MKEKVCKIILIILLIWSFVIIPVLVYKASLNFQVKEFKEQIEIPYNSEFKPNDGNVCFGNKLICKKVKVREEDNVNTSVVGEYKATYMYKYKKKTLLKEQTIKVVDNTPPVISVEGDNFNLCPNATVSNFPASAYDEYDGDITSKIEQSIVDNKILFKVTDTGGNLTELYKDATFIDSTPPTITLNGSNTVYVKLNGKYTESFASAFDDCDGDISSKIEVSGTVNTSKTGTYKITYTVTDSSNNTSSVERKVSVYTPVNNNNSSSGGTKVIYLTFDDGPSAYTSKLLDTLKKYNVKATFFVTGQNLSKYSDVVLRAYNEGHTIGLHSDTHNYNIYTNVDTYFNDLYRINEKVKNIIGKDTYLIRFPGGSSNTVSRNHDNGSKIMTVLTNEVVARGYKYFDWNISSGDAGETTSTAKVVKNITSNLGSKSYIVLQHDTKSFSVDAVEEVITYALARGYTFKPLTADSPTAHHRVNN